MVINDKLKKRIQNTLLLCSILTVMSGATIAPALPSIQAHFSEHPKADLLVRLVLTAPALFIGLGSPLAGSLVDRFGRMPILVGGLLIYALAGGAAYFLNDLYLLLLSRALLGVAVAGLMTATTTLVGDYFEGADRNRFLSIQGSFMAFGGVVSITLGGLLADLSWRAPFLLYLFSLVVLPMVLGFLWEPHREAPMGKVQASASPLPRSKVILIYLAGFFGMMMFYAIPTQVPFYLENNLEVSPTVSGLAIASTTLAAATISYHYPKLRRRLSFPLIYTYAFSVMSLGFLSLGFADSIGLVVPALFVCGLGAGVTIPNANLWLISITPERWRGRLMGGLTSAIFVGQFVSPLALTPFRNWLSVALLFELLAPLVLCVGLAFLGFDYAQRQAPQRVPE